MEECKTGLTLSFQLEKLSSRYEMGLEKHNLVMVAQRKFQGDFKKPLKPDAPN